MTQTDFLTATAVVESFERLFKEGASGSATPEKYPDKEAKLTADDAKGGALPTRKSTRAANAVLASFTPCRVLTRNSRWYIRTGDGELLDYTGRIAEVNIA